MTGGGGASSVLLAKYSADSPRALYVGMFPLPPVRTDRSPITAYGKILATVFDDGLPPSSELIKLIISIGQFGRVAGVDEKPFSAFKSDALNPVWTRPSTENFASSGSELIDASDGRAMAKVRVRG